MTVALRDDVISRFSPQALERLQKELRDLDLEAAKQVLPCQKPLPHTDRLPSTQLLTPGLGAPAEGAARPGS